MKPTRQSAKGFVVLYLVLVLASTLTGLALAAGQSASSVANRLRSTDEGATVQILANECGEKLLMQVRTAPNTNISGSIVTTIGTCTYVISGSPPIKTIAITATVGKLFKRLTIRTSQINPMILATWIEGA